jgi:hypothetical protein
MHYAAAAASGAIARYRCASGASAAKVSANVRSTHPMDTVRTRLQMESGNGAIRALSRAVQSEGLRGLYRGVNVTVLFGMPGVSLYLTSYDAAKLNLSKSNAPASLVHLTSGLIAEVYLALRQHRAY